MLRGTYVQLQRQWVEMLSDDELLRLYRGDERDFVERKESAGDRDRIRQAICALANDLPNHRRTGVVFVGQRDDRSCANLEVDQELLAILAGLRSEGKILPFPTMYVRKAVLEG